jgi:hypothetical protein
MSLKDKVSKEGGNEEAVDLAEQIDEIHDITALATSEGGKKLVVTLLKDVTTQVLDMAQNSSNYDLAKFQGVTAKLRANLDLVKLLNSSEENEDYLKDLLKDALA